jgi:hypothetical protein
MAKRIGVKYVFYQESFCKIEKLLFREKNFFLQLLLVSKQTGLKLSFKTAYRFGASFTTSILWFCPQFAKQAVNGGIKLLFWPVMVIFEDYS